MARAHRMPQGREFSDDLVEVAEGLGVGEWLFEGYLARDLSIPQPKGTVPEWTARSISSA